MKGMTQYDKETHMAWQR